VISDDTSTGRRYRHNGDFSGEIVIIMDETEVEHEQFAGDQYVTVTIPLQDLRDIAAQAARPGHEQRAADLVRDVLSRTHRLLRRIDSPGSHCPRRCRPRWSTAGIWRSPLMSCKR
jgi:hypothetical protein